MSTKHTATRLKACRDHPNTKDIVYIREVDSDPITSSEIAVLFNGIDRERQDYFAKLFANAPETLRQRDALLAFAKWCIEEYCWDCCDPDGGSIQDKAESLGLIHKVVATAKHYDPESSDFDIGDEIYEFVDFLADCEATKD